MRRMHPHHCRRAILIGLGLFCAVQLTVSIGAPWLMPWMREPVYGRKLVCLRKRIKSTPKSSLVVVVIGSSRTLNGLRGEVVESILTPALSRPVTVFNLGVPGADSFGNLVHLRRLLADGI